MDRTSNQNASSLGSDSNRSKKKKSMSHSSPKSGNVKSSLAKNDLHDKSEKHQERGSESNLCKHYEEKVRPCIDLIDSLRALGVEQDLALPAIAVIGDQSSGKSSVLEALSGVALPRGSGIVTRCPLVLKLKKLKKGEDWSAKISYEGIQREFSEPSEVEEEINKAQNLIAGKGLQISHNLIDLEVRSPRVSDLTLIDLPGITRVPVGNQPADIGQQIKRLIRTYIKKQETINLVVVPSNVDIATTEALSMAQEVDPEGDRTIGILTKPDLVDKGTEDKVVDVVRNLVCHLKKGYMIVKCRSQKDIQMQLSLDEALRKEEDFFKDHPQFRTLLEDGKATVPCLAERLTTELITHISKCLPLLEDEIQEKYQNTNEELQKYGMGVPQDNNEKTLFLIEKINGFNQDITALIQGEESIDKEGIFRLFTKLRSEFHCWSVTINQSFSKGYEALKKEVWRLEKQHRGRELPGFVNYKAFEMIIKKQVKALEQPAVEILHKVTDMIRLTFTNTSEKHFEEFFNLHRTTKSKIEDIRLELEMEAEKSIRLHFQMEQIVYCEDQVYRKALQKVREKEEQEKNSNQSRKSNHQFQTEDLSMPEILQHLNAYYEEVHSRISSHIPLIIQHFVLQTFGERLQKSMLQLLQDTDACSQLLLERSDTREKRMFLKERLARLTQARRQLGKFTG